MKKDRGSHFLERNKRRKGKDFGYFFFRGLSYKFSFFKARGKSRSISPHTLTQGTLSCDLTLNTEKRKRESK